MLLIVLMALMTPSFSSGAIGCLNIKEGVNYQNIETVKEERLKQLLDDYKGPELPAKEKEILLGG